MTSESGSGSVSMPPTDAKAGKEALLYFITAFAFLLAGVAALVWNSARLSQGAFSDPKVLGGLHWITLGWLSLSILGALRVFTGVALGNGGKSPQCVPWVHALWSLGALIFPAGLMMSQPVMIMSGAMLIGLALALHTFHIVPALRQANRGGPTRWYLVISLASLWGAWILGGCAAFARAGVVLCPLPAGYFLAHVLLAVFGWVGATVVGVGAHLIPMFALSREPKTWPVQFALPFWGAIPVCGVIGAFAPNPFLTMGWSSAAIGSMLWLVQVVIYFRSRLRRERDPGLMLSAGATLLLGVAWGMIIFSRAPVASAGLLVIGWLTLFTLGIYHRVIPFLVWFARFARNAGKSRVPKVKELVDERIANITAVLSLSGASIWALGIATMNGFFAYLGSSLILVGCLSALCQLRTLLGSTKPAAPVSFEFFKERHVP